MTPRSVIIRYIAILAACAMLGLGAWAVGRAHAGVDLTPAPQPPGSAGIHFTIEAVHGRGTPAQHVNLIEAVAVELALTGRHDERASRKVRIAVLVSIVPSAPECRWRHRPGQLVVVTWLVREGPLGSLGRTLGSVGQTQCRSPQADVWGEIARYAVAPAVAGVLKLIDGTAVPKAERDV